MENIINNNNRIAASINISSEGLVPDFWADEIIDKGVIGVYNGDDSVFDTLSDLNLQSATKGACTSRFTSFVTSNGNINIDTNNTFVFDVLSNRINDSFEGLGDIAIGIVQQLEVYGNCVIRLVKSDKSTIKVDVLDFKYIRYCMDGSVVYYNSSIYSLNHQTYQRFWHSDSAGVFSRVIVVSNKVAGVRYYGLPNSIYSVREQSLQIKNAVLQTSVLDRGVAGSGMLVVQGNYTQEELNKIAADFRATYTGGNSGGIMVFCGDSSDSVTYKSLNAPHNFVDNANDMAIIKKIASTCGVPLTLLGYDENAGMGSSGSYHSEVVKSFYLSVVLPYRKRIFRILNRIVLEIDSFYKSKTTIYFDGSLPFVYGDNFPATPNEIRRQFGFEDLPEGNKLKI